MKGLTYFSSRTIALIDGVEVPYDACSSNVDAYDPNFFEYIGTGTIYKINGVKQRSVEILHFWKNKNQHQY